MYTSRTIIILSISNASLNLILIKVEQKFGRLISHLTGHTILRRFPQLCHRIMKHFIDDFLGHFFNQLYFILTQLF